MQREYLFYISGSWTLGIKAHTLKQAIVKARKDLSSSPWLLAQDGHNNHVLLGSYQTASPSAFCFSPKLRHFKE